VLETLHENSANTRESWALRDSKENKATNYRKSVGAIHSWADLNLLGHKLLNGMIHHAYDGILEEKAHFMTFKQAYEYMGIKSRNTAHLRSVVQSIAHVQVEWDFLGEEGNYCREQKELARANLEDTKKNPRFKKIIASKYFKKLEADLQNLQASGAKNTTRQVNALIEKQLDALFPEFTIASVFEEASIHTGGLLSYSFNMRTALRLCDPLLYAKVDLSALKSFKKKGAFKLYENGCRYQRVGKTPWLSIELAKKMLGVEKTSSGEFAYPEYATLRQGVIDPAVKEINQFYKQGVCQFSVNYRIKKAGRKVSHIQFLFTTLKGAEAEDMSRRLEEMGVNNQIAKKLSTQFSRNYLLAQINYTQERLAHKTKSGNPGGYLVDCIRKNYAGISEESDTKSVYEKTKKEPERSDQTEGFALTGAEDLFNASGLLKGLWLGFVPEHLRERTLQLGSKWQIREVKGLLKHHLPEPLWQEAEENFKQLLRQIEIKDVPS